MIWRVLFSVVMAALLIGVLAAFIRAQQKTETSMEARNLATNISRMAFSRLAGGQMNYELPLSVGGAPYELAVDEERGVIIVRIIGGSLKGVEFMGVVDAPLVVHSLPSPGDVLYIGENLGKIVLSASPLEFQLSDVSKFPSQSPPPFYDFAKENPRDAAAIAAAYFWARINYPELAGDLDVLEYKWEGSSDLLARITSDSELVVTADVSGRKISEKIGVVTDSWIIEGVDGTDVDVNGSSNPSVREAYQNGWLYSPSHAHKYLQSRGWNREGETVSVPLVAEVNGSASTTNVGTFPTYRVGFSASGIDYVLYYQAMPWWYAENRAGFTFQSKPELVAIT